MNRFLNFDSSEFLDLHIKSLGLRSASAFQSQGGREGKISATPCSQVQENFDKRDNL
jgi:hypothetical protein